MKVRVKILSLLPGVFMEYQPKVGKIYDAHYIPSRNKGCVNNKDICVITVKDKKIALRKGEYKIMEE